MVVTGRSELLIRKFLILRALYDRRWAGGAFFLSYFMCICNPLGYDRPDRFYIYHLARLDAPYLFISALSPRV